MPYAPQKSSKEIWDSFLFVFASFFIYNSVKTYAVNKKKNIFVKIEGAAPKGVAVVNSNDFVIRG